MPATIDPNNTFHNAGQASAVPSQSSSLPSSARNDAIVNPLQNVYDNSQGNFLGTMPDLGPPRKAPVVMDTVVDRQDPDLPNNGVDGEAANLGLPFLQMIWPGWPPHLPTPGQCLSTEGEEAHLQPLSTTWSTPFSMSYHPSHVYFTSNASWLAFLFLQRIQTSLMLPFCTPSVLYQLATQRWSGHAPWPR